MSAILLNQFLINNFFIDIMSNSVEGYHCFKDGLQILVLNVNFLLAVKWLQKGEFRVT